MKRKRGERRRIRKLKFRTLFMLSLTLIFNTYAWFLYVTTVSTNMTVHVDAWSVSFEVNNQVVEKDILFEINEAYPGMKEVEQKVSITNSGEKDAKISYKIISLRVLDKIYIVEEELTTEEKADLDGTELKISSEEMDRMITNDFPFIITIECDSEILKVQEKSEVSMKMNWSYENGDDELDTKYGVDSYKYYQETAGQSAIQAKIKLKAQQNKE